MFPAYFDDSLLQDIWSAALSATPVFLLLQVAALVILLWRVAFKWQLEQLATRLAERWILQLGVAVAPPVMLLASSAFHGGYQGERGGWFFHTNSGVAGLALVPVYVAGSAIVARGLALVDYRLRSGIHIVVLRTLLAICIWYAFATAVLEMSDDRALDVSALAFVPALAAVNYALLIVDVMRHNRLEPTPTQQLQAWFFALILSLLAKVPLAMRIYDALPPEMPDGYGDCFVVSAAARGHPGVVGSRFDAQLGRTVNQQWRTLRAFENQLATRQPRLHQQLRRIYNIVGPPVAARVRSPIRADLVYLMLKPLEWLARLYVSDLWGRTPTFTDSDP